MQIIGSELDTVSAPVAFSVGRVRVENVLGEEGGSVKGLMDVADGMDNPANGDSAVRGRIGTFLENGGIEVNCLNDVHPQGFLGRRCGVEVEILFSGVFEGCPIGGGCPCRK